MAHVLLPCDLPNWITVKKNLKAVSECKSIAELIPCIKKLYDLCSISLDPDDLTCRKDSSKFDGFRDFLLNLSTRECSTFFEEILPKIAELALNLQVIRPISGLQYFLQLQNAEAEFSLSLTTSLLACSFFSVFPKRTPKTHPTLNNFNFAELFGSLKNGLDVNKKLHSVINHFKGVKDGNLKGSMRFCRRIDDDPLTVSDWLDSDELLCEVKTTSEKWDQSDIGKTHVCFCNFGTNGATWSNQEKAESDVFYNNPNILPLLLFMEILTDREIITAHQFENSSKCPELSANIPPKTSYILLKDSKKAPYEEESILYDLNQTYLGFSDRWLYENSAVSSELVRESDKEDSRFAHCNDKQNSEDSEQVPSNKINIVFTALDPRPGISIADPKKNEDDDMEEKSILIKNFELTNDQDQAEEALKINNEELAKEVDDCESQVDSFLRPLAFQMDPSVEKSDSISSFISCLSNTTEGDDLDFFSACQSFEASDEEMDENENFNRESLTSALGRRLLAQTLSNQMTPGRRSYHQYCDPSEQYAVNVEIQGPGLNDGGDIYRLSRASSRGFVLEGSEGSDDEDDTFFNRHSDEIDWSETLNRRAHFRRPHSFNRSSRMSSMDSRYTTDDDDFDEDYDNSDCEYATFTGMRGRYSMIRKANSEPLLPSMCAKNAFGMQEDLVVIAQKLQTLESSNPANFVTDIIGAKLKSYSFDGVNANLPVPYRAKFRRKRPEERNPEKRATRSTISPLRLVGSLMRRRNMFGRSHSDSLPTGSNLSREVLEEEEEEEEESNRVDVLADDREFTEIIPETAGKQELNEIKEEPSIRPNSVSSTSEVSETNTITDDPTKLEVPKRRRMFYVQSTETFDSDEEFDVNFMKKLEVKAAALSVSQEHSKGIGTQEEFDLMKRPISLSSLQKNVMLNTDEDQGGALRKWKATTNLADLIAQYNNEGSESDYNNDPTGSCSQEELRAFTETMLVYDSIADELVFDAFCDAFVTLTEEVYSPKPPEPTYPIQRSNVETFSSDIPSVDPQEPKDEESKKREEKRHTKPIVTGSREESEICDPQVIAIIQWLAASKSCAPLLIYHIELDHNINKFDVIVKTLRRRNWTVGQLCLALFRYCETVITMSEQSGPKAAPVPLFVYLLDCATRRSSSQFSSESSSTHFS